MPGVYFHSLFGSRGDRAGAEACGIPRRINREKLDRARLEAELSESGSLRGLIWRGMQDLLRIRNAHRAFHPQAAQHVLATHDSVLALWRISPEKGEQVLCMHNVSAHPASTTGIISDAMSALAWTDLLTGRHCEPGSAGGAAIVLGGFETLWLGAETQH